MAITKKQRREVWNKSNGFCWYCGCDLTGKGWHVDHIKPIRRYNDIYINEKGVKNFNTCENPHLDTLENMVPACRKCNLFKGVFSVEQFRNEIRYQVDRARDYSVNFRNAERFGLIEVIDKPVIFWFEMRNL